MIRQWDAYLQCGATEALEFITCEKTFLETFISQPDSCIRRSKGLSNKDTDDLVAWGTVHQLDDTSQAMVWMNAFKVKKSDGKARFAHQ